MILLVLAGTTTKIQIVPTRCADTGNGGRYPRVGRGGVRRCYRRQVDVAPGHIAVVTALGEVSPGNKDETVSKEAHRCYLGQQHSPRGRNQRAIVVGDAQIEVDEGPVVGVVLDIVGVAVHAQGGVVGVEVEAAHGTGVIEGNAAVVHGARERLHTVGLRSSH